VGQRGGSGRLSLIFKLETPTIYIAHSCLRDTETGGGEEGKSLSFVLIPYIYILYIAKQILYPFLKIFLYAAQVVIT
jgi:hypothetical protein